MDELRGLLAAMGAPIGANSRLQEDALERKLRLAIGYAQNMPELTKKLPVNPVQLPVWQTLGGQSAVNAFSRASIAEVLEIERTQMLGGDPSSASLVSSQSAFLDLRETLAALAECFDDGRRVVLLQDENQQSGIALRMFGVYALDSQIPLIPLAYEVASTPEERKTGNMSRFLQSQLRGDDCAQIICTPQDLALIRRVLQFNSSKLASEYEASLAPDQRGLQLSFIIPVVPLDKTQIGKVMHNVGCTVCGSAEAKSCSGCKIERYCSSACQKAHWKDHKDMCRYMQGGTWTDFTFTDAPTFNGQKLVGATIGTSSTPDKIKKTKMHGGDGDANAPPNKYGERAFLIKIQRLQGRGMPGMPPVQLLYDGLRTLNGYLEPESNVAVWPAFEQEMPPDLVGVMMYCWARRTGDWGLSICLDRRPRGSEVPQW
ncbi:hypothetical protein PENSPDRAFT_740613 [Peniophora sp. CONT]|nr:hypothetical protein PENSPDRAFT_740613 [Peniophora sp. CONT]